MKIETAIEAAEQDTPTSSLPCPTTIMWLISSELNKNTSIS